MESELFLQKSTGDLRKITEHISSAISQLTIISNKENLVRTSLETDAFKDLLEEVSTSLTQTIQAYATIQAKCEIITINDKRRFKIDSEVSTIFSDFNKRKSELQSRLSPYLNNEEIKKQIDILNKSISEDKASLQAINQLQREIIDCKKSLQIEKEKLFRLYEENYNEYLSIIQLLKLRTIDLEKEGLKIEGLAKFNFTKLQRAIFDFSDGRKGSWRNYNLMNENKNSLSSYNLEELLTELKRIFEAIAESQDYALVKGFDAQSAIKKLLDDYFFDFWEIEYKGDKLGEMSTGKASFVILMLIVGLSKSKAPILIDQPEDNLDNRSITTELVEYLRNKKLERQIILVTHNPNIVVNADAENIIVANQKGQNEINTSSPYQFDYINGGLENSFTKKEEETNLLSSMGIREHIAEIVEGGKEAFMKREKKYGF